MNFNDYKRKVAGCWAGKNAGGVLGAPFEGKRQMNRVEFYTQDLSMGPPPNDDLDLQIIWLAAAERYGRNVNAMILGEYWLSYVIPNWVEYGMGKANLRNGVLPPMSGYMNNAYRNSCGCFIRSEIWACLAPGHPDIAARYAYEDGIVDHAGEGVYGEVFCAAVQSAAFAEEEIPDLLSIGLSYIPEGCAVARCVKAACSCYEEKLPFDEARKCVHQTAPGTFGIQNLTNSEIERLVREEELDIGEPGFDAPENIGFMILGWLYGEGDFGKSLCLAVNCGEDTDCTAATLGALLGILSGIDGIPDKWLEPINDKIVTLCINKTEGGIWIPDTVTELTHRVAAQMPAFLGSAYCKMEQDGDYTIYCKKGMELRADSCETYMENTNGGGKDQRLNVKELCLLSPFVVRYDFPAFWMAIDYLEEPYFEKGKKRRFRVTVVNGMEMHEQQWVSIRLYLPRDISCKGASCVRLPLNNLWGSKAEKEFELDLENYDGEKAELMVQVSLIGRHSRGSAEIIFFQK